MWLTNLFRGQTAERVVVPTAAGAEHTLAEVAVPTVVEVARRELVPGVVVHIQKVAVPEGAVHIQKVAAPEVVPVMAAATAVVGRS
jgi:hypothetical protein